MGLAPRTTSEVHWHPVHLEMNVSWHTPSEAAVPAHHLEDLAQVNSVNAHSSHIEATHTSVTFVNWVATLVINHLLRLVAHYTVGLLDQPEFDLGKPPHYRVSGVSVGMPLCADTLVLLLVFV